jgi:hypothetical protein
MKRHASLSTKHPDNTLVKKSDVREGLGRVKPNPGARGSRLFSRVVSITLWAPLFWSSSVLLKKGRRKIQAHPKGPGPTCSPCAN